MKALPLHKITVTAAGSWFHLGGLTQKNHAFKQPLNYRIWNALPRPNII